MITIYRYKSNQPRAVLRVDDSSEQRKSLMREDVLVLNFTTVAPIGFQRGDFCRFMNQLYQVNSLPGRTVTSKREITYALQMEAEFYDLRKVQFLSLDANNNFTDGNFILRNTPRGFMELIIYNMQRVFPLAEWKLGNCIDGDFKTLEFKGVNCLEAIQQIADQYQTEYHFDGKTMHLFQRQVSSGIILTQGKDHPMVSFEESQQDSADNITRLIAYGSTRNLPENYRGGARNLMLPDTLFIETDERERIVERTVFFDGSNGTEEVYPHRTGKVTQVDDPFNFRDSSMDFNVLSYLVPGQSAKITFNTGLLAGYEFEIAENGYDPALKRFTLLKNNDETVISVPSENYKPAVGDEYVITDIYMPPIYVTKAEQRLLTVAKDYLTANQEPPLVYSIEANRMWMRINAVDLKLGSSVQLDSDVLDISTLKRITSYTRKINDIYLYGIDLADTVPAKSSLIKLIS